MKRIHDMKSRELNYKKNVAFFKIMDCIRSSTDWCHLNACKRMIHSFQKMFEKDFKSIDREVEILRNAVWGHSSTFIIQEEII